MRLRTRPARSPLIPIGQVLVALGGVFVAYLAGLLVLFSMNPVTGADVAEDAVALGHHERLEAGRAQLGGDQVGRAELLAGQLRVRVDVAPYRDEVRTVDR